MFRVLRVLRVFRVLGFGFRLLGFGVWVFRAIWYPLRRPF